MEEAGHVASSCTASAFNLAESKVEPTALPEVIGPKVPVVGLCSVFQAQAPSADLELLAAQLQTLAEEMGRLRQGLESLVAASNSSAAYRPGPTSTGLGAREFSPLLAADETTISAAGGVEGAKGRALWRMLLEAQALLGDMMVAGGQPPGAAGVFTDECLRRGPAHGKKARAAAAAAAAASAAVPATALREFQDTMVLAGRPYYDNHDSWALAPEELVLRLDSPGQTHCQAVGQPAVVGSNCSWTRSGGGETPARIVSIDNMAIWEPGESQLGSAINNEAQMMTQIRSKGNVDAGTSNRESGLTRNRELRSGVPYVSSASNFSTPGVPLQQLDIIPFLSNCAPSWLGIGPAQFPSDPLNFPTHIATLHSEPAVSSGVDICYPGKRSGTQGGNHHSCHRSNSCARLSPGPQQHSAGQSNEQQPQFWPCPPVVSTNNTAPPSVLVGQGSLFAEGCPGCPVAVGVTVPYVQARGGQESPPLQNLLLQPSSTESATAAGSALGRRSLLAATRYCI